MAFLGIGGGRERRRQEQAGREKKRKQSYQRWREQLQEAEVKTEGEAIVSRGQELGQVLRAARMGRRGSAFGGEAGSGVVDSLRDASGADYADALELKQSDYVHRTASHLGGKPSDNDPDAPGLSSEDRRRRRKDRRRQRNLKKFRAGQGLIDASA